MSNRKETPDVLAALMGGQAETPQPDAPAAPTRAPRKARPRPAAPAPLASTVVWEYRTLTLRDFRGWRVRAMDDAELDDWKNGPELRRFLDELGRTGWELAAVLPAPHGEQTAYLKRRA